VYPAKFQFIAEYFLSQHLIQLLLMAINEIVEWCFVFFVTNGKYLYS
jgi:hypothetical protein